MCKPIPPNIIAAADAAAKQASIAAETSYAKEVTAAGKPIDKREMTSRAYNARNQAYAATRDRMMAELDGIATASAPATARATVSPEALAAARERLAAKLGKAPAPAAETVTPPKDGNHLDLVARLAKSGIQRHKDTLAAWQAAGHIRPLANGNFRINTQSK